MSEVRQHNRDRWPKSQSKFKNYGTQSEEKSTRTIGTMSEPVKTRNFGNDAQPQSSATQTSILLQQQSLYKLTEQDDIDLKPSTSQRSQYDSRTNGYYPSQRSTSAGHQNQYVPSSLMSPRQKDYSDYDEHQVPHLSQYNDDPRDQYITTRNDYQRSTIQRPHYSSQTRQHIPPSTNLHRTSPPTVEYRSTSLNDRYRTPSPSNHHHFPQSQRSRSPSPLIQKHISTSTNRQRTASPPSQRRSPSPPIQKHISTSTSRQHTASPPSQRLSRQLQRSPSPPSSRHHISSSTKLHRTSLPPDEHRSTSPNNRHHSPLSPSKNYSRKTKDRRRMVSAETDTSLDGMKPQQHRGSQPESPSTREYGTTTNTEGKHPTQTSYSTNPNTRASIAQYETLNSSLPKRQDYTITSPYQDNDNLLRNDQPPSTRKNYRLRPVQDDSNVNNYEQIPSKHDESISAEYTRSFDRPKEYTSKPFTGDRHYQASPTFEQRSDEEEQHISITFTDDGSNEKFFRDLPTGGSISIPKSTVIEPDTLPRSHGQNKSPTHQKHDRVQYREKIAESPLRHGQQRIASIGDSPPLNFGSENILYQSPNNEFTTPFETRYVHDTDDEFGTANNDIRSSTLKRDGLRPRNNRILLLPVINSSRTYVFEKQALPGNHVRQSRINGNFYLATSPTLHSLNSSFQVDDSEIDSTNLNRYGLRSQVA